MKSSLGKRLLSIFMVAVMAFSVVYSPLLADNVNAATNPYPQYQNTEYPYPDEYVEIPCTRFAWQQVYDNSGIALPKWGDAVNWWDGAKNSGFARGYTPKPGAVAVWSGDKYGHVAYVTSGSGNTFTVNEGGRTDLDHTASQGVAYGYTLTNAVGGQRPYDTNKILLGFIYPSESAPIVGKSTVSVTKGTSATATKITWTAASNASYYNLRLYKYNGTEYVTYKDINNLTSRSYSITLAAGHYAAAVTACNGGSSTTSANAHFTINSWYADKTAVNLGDDFYARIVLTSTNIAPGVNASTRNIENVTYDNERNMNYRSQFWHFVRNSDGSYKIFNAFSSYYGNNQPLEAVGTTSGSRVALGTYYSGNNKQLWYIYGPENGKYIIRNKASDFVLNVDCAYASAGTKLQIWTYTDSVAERMTIEKHTPVNKTTLGVRAYSENDDVYFHWTKPSGELKWYYMHIDQIDASGKIIKSYDQSNIDPETTYKYVKLPAGNYKASITSNSLFNSAFSDEIEFSVDTNCIHSWKKETTKAPTCTESGIQTNTCEKCGKTETQTIGKKGHYIITDNAVAATCTKTGLTKGEHCKYCSYKVEQQVVPKKDHTLETDKAVKATCTKTGLTEGKHCTKCDYKIAQEIIPALGHDIVKDTAVTATCTNSGLTEGEHCTRCSYKVKQQYVSKAPHDYVLDSEIAATCAATGQKIYYCSICDKKKTESTPKLNHNIVKDAAVAATCTKTGLTEGEHCTKCDYKEAQQTVDKTDHNYGAYVTIEKAGFGTDGKKTATCINKGCGSTKEEVIDWAFCGLDYSTYTFNNKNKTPKVYVNDINFNDIKYTATYPKARKNVGKYAIKVKLTGADYEGTETLYFKINPAGKSISKLSKGKKSFTVKWSKPSSTYRKQMTGYQIKYSTSSKMSKSKTVTVKSTKATSKTIKKLKAKKNYYVQLRTYKKIGKSYYYSGWSKIKKVKTK